MSRITLIEQDTLTEEGLKFTSGKCVGCGTCELICSFYHDRVFAPSSSGIRLVHQEYSWYRHEAPKPFTVSVCRQCPWPSPCAVVCPVEGALSWRADIGAIVLDYSLCISCRKCVAECPYGAIYYNERTEKVIKCDLCNGDPQCVKWCPAGVLQLTK